MNLKQLRELAEAAAVNNKGAWFPSADLRDSYDWCDADFIAAADPQTIIALLDLVELAHKEMLAIHPADAAVFLEAYDAFNKEQT